ncbi:hypothetical protein LguiB_031276 [Lonicera macranthoides]
MKYIYIYIYVHLLHLKNRGKMKHPFRSTSSISGHLPSYLPTPPRPPPPSSSSFYTQTPKFLERENSKSNTPNPNKQSVQYNF